MCNGTPFSGEKISPRAGLELGTARSVGQRLLTELPGLLIFVVLCSMECMCKIERHVFLQNVLRRKPDNEHRY